MTTTVEDIAALSDDELRALYDEHRRLADRCWHTLAARAARRDVAYTQADWTRDLRAHADPETERRFRERTAIDNVVRGMLDEDGFDAATITVAVTAAFEVAPEVVTEAINRATARRTQEGTAGFDT